jgi:hypothetical protein
MIARGRGLYIQESGFLTCMRLVIKMCAVGDKSFGGGKNTRLWIFMDKLMDIFMVVKTRGRITVKDIVSLSNANRNTVKKHLENLVENNYLEQNGVGTGTWYSGNG